MVSEGDKNEDCIMIKILLMICASEKDLFELADFNACVKYFFYFPATNCVMIKLHPLECNYLLHNTFYTWALEICHFNSAD